MAAIFILGGSELMHTRADDGESQWAVVLDPNGAAFGIIPSEAIPPSPADEVSPVGRIYWLDLTVADAPATRDFYRQVVGWSVQNVAMEDGGERYADYNMLGDDGAPAAGVCHSRGLNAGLPQVWLIYLPVGDLTESLRRVHEEGGNVIKMMSGEDGEHAYEVIQDPVGVYLALIPG